jgi:hypothetical protein
MKRWSHPQTLWGDHEKALQQIKAQIVAIKTASRQQLRDNRRAAARKLLIPLWSWSPPVRSRKADFLIMA